MSVRLAKECVLLVDDEPQILTALEDLLGGRYTVLKSESPARALELVQNNNDIAVVITDQRMPQMSGDEFLSKIGNDNQALRIMVSGAADLPAVLRAVNDGRVYAYVTKPWDEEELLRKVQAAAEHFRVARELESERRLLRDLMDNSPDGIYFKDADLRFLRANASFVRSIGGTNPEDFVGRKLSEILGVATQSGEDEDRQVLRDGQPILDAVRQYSYGGADQYTSETKAPISSRAGSALGLVGISRNVTERVKISEALRASEGELQHQTRILNSILDGMGDGVVVAGSAGRTLLINKEARRVLGIEARDVPLESWAEVYGLYLSDGTTPLPIEQNPLFRAMNGEALVQLELRVKNAVSPAAIVAVTATPLRDMLGASVGAIVLLRDVTRQRNLEQHLAHSQKMEAIGQLAGGVAHDFNNLLTVIVGCSELALEEFEPSDARRGNVVEVLSAARNATLLTQQLLAFSRRQVIQPRPLQLNDVIAGMDGVLRRLLGKQIELTTVLSRDLSQVHADQSQLEQVMLNLVVNARDAMPQGGMLRLETDEEALAEGAAYELGIKAGRFVVLSVVDTGTGMSEETQERLFDPFFTTKDVGKGTGLGLATVYGIVRQGGGHVSVHSAPGQGTEFRLLFPKAAPGERVQTSIAPEKPGTALGAILLIDGDAAVRQITARMLRSEGHSVTELPNLAAARESLAQGARVDLILADIGLIGHGAANEVSELHSGARVLFMTGGGPPMKDAHKPLSEGSTLLAKPFARQQLLEKVQQALSGSDSYTDAP